MRNTSWLSLGSGHAFLEALLSVLDVSIVATDPGILYPVPSHVLQMNATASVQQFRTAQGLFFSWPSLEEDWAAHSLLLMPAMVILIGDEKITADSKFFQLLSNHYSELQTLPTSHWTGKPAGCEMLCTSFVESRVCRLPDYLTDLSLSFCY
jgi:hypothetical protein